jgi:hypothetical protein
LLELDAEFNSASNSSNQETNSSRKTNLDEKKFDYGANFTYILRSWKEEKDNKKRHYVKKKTRKKIRRMARNYNKQAKHV